MRKFILMTLIVLNLSATLSLQAAQYEKPSYWDSFVAEAINRYRITVDFWRPRVKKVYEQTRDYWSREFYETIHPWIIKHYKIYLDKYGYEVGRNFMISYDYVKPRVVELFDETIEYYDTNHPITMQFLGDIPAFVKIYYEKFILKIWSILYEMEDQNFDSLSEQQKASLGMAMHASAALGKERNDAISRRLERLLNEIKGYSRDYGMQDCYRVVVLDMEMLNAFNTGCHVFVTEEIIEVLEDDASIRAMLAHEISHGDRGHGLKTFFSLVGANIKHFSKLTMEEMVWIATGEAFDYFKETVEHGHQHLVMDDFGKTAPAIELDADKHAAIMLNKAGYSGNDLIIALKKLHFITGKTKCDKESIDGVRDYPTFCNRERTVREAMKF